MKTPKEQIREHFMTIARHGINKIKSDLAGENEYECFDKETAEEEFEELVTNIKKHF